MLRGNFITAWMATAVLAVATFVSAPCLAQRNSFRPMQGRPGIQNHPQGRQGHAGDWLRHYQGLPPGEAGTGAAERSWLPAFASGAAADVAAAFATLLQSPPQQQQRMLNRMETGQALTPGKEQARQVFNRMRQLPPERRAMVHTAIRALRGPAHQVSGNRLLIPIASAMFSPQERDITVRRHQAAASACRERQTGNNRCAIDAVVSALKWHGFSRAASSVDNAGKFSP